MPYEQCNWTNKAYTKRLLEDFHNYFPKTESCSDCFMPAKKDQDEGFFRFIKSFFPYLEQQQTKGEKIPIECFFASGTKTLTKKPSSMHYYYCESAKSRKTSRRMKLIDPQGKERQISPRNPCLNLPYARMTSEAFSLYDRLF